MKFVLILPIRQRWGVDGWVLVDAGSSASWSFSLLRTAPFLMKWYLWGSLSTFFFICSISCGETQMAFHRRTDSIVPGLFNTNDKPTNNLSQRISESELSEDQPAIQYTSFDLPNLNQSCTISDLVEYSSRYFLTIYISQTKFQGDWGRVSRSKLDFL